MHNNSQRIMLLSVLLLLSSAILSACSVNPNPTNSSNSQKITWEYLQVTVICDAKADVTEQEGNTWEMICFQPSEPNGFEELTELDEILNKYGLNGWELVSADRETLGYAEGIYILIFKQPKQ